MQIKGIIEEIGVGWSEFGNRSRNLTNLLLRFLRLIMVTVGPVIVGTYLQDPILKQLKDGTLRLNLQTIEDLWPFIIAIAISIIGFIWGTDHKAREIRFENVDYALRWFYEDLGFANDKESDVRITLWSPINSSTVPARMKVMQVINYFPIVGTEKETPHDFRMNKNRGRIQKVCKIDNGRLKPIGIVGRCIIKSIKDHDAYIIPRIIGDHEVFDDLAQREWNFNKAEIKRLTKNRRAFVGITLMDSGKTDVLGVIFMDAKRPDAFTTEIIDRAQHYLPRIAEILTS